VTGRHRGKLSLRWQVFVAVLADLVGRGYTGQHRLAGAAAVAPAQVDLLPRQRPAGDGIVPASPVVTASPVMTVASSAATAPALVPAPSVHPDRLADTAPHPVVKLFPMPVELAPGEGAAELSNAELSNATA
jgi:hypothetical protein